MLNLAFFVLALLPYASADSAPIKGRVNELAKPVGVSDAHPFVKRYCEGAPYTNTFCCGSLFYCYDGEVCCSSYYCCPGGTTCLGGLMCSNNGVFTETGSPITSAAPATTVPPTVTSLGFDYFTFYYTITWYYYTYYYTYDYYLTTTVLESYRRTTYDYFTITATDESAASSSLDSITATISFSVPASETAPTPISIPSVPSVSSTPRVTLRPTTTRSIGGNFSVPTTATSSFPSFPASGAERALGGSVWIAGWRIVAWLSFALGLPGLLMVAL